MNTLFSIVSPLVITFAVYIYNGVQLVKEGELAVLYGLVILVVSVLPIMLHLLILTLQEKLGVKLSIEAALSLVLLALLFAFI